MSVPSSMVHRSGNDLIVRSVVSGDVIPLTTPSPAAATPAAGVAVPDPDASSKEDLLPDCKVKRNYTCTACDFFTQNPRVYLYHLRDVHRERVRVYECPSCLYASRHFQKLLRHTKMVHGRATPPPTPHQDKRKAAEAASSPEDEEDVVEEEPLVSEGKQNLFKCSVCEFTSKGQVQLSRHEREEHIKTKFFRCSKCTYVTHIKARYTKHVKYHSMPMIKCDMCDFRTPYKWNLDRHCKNHNGNGAFRCSACNFTADIKQSLTVHEMNHHVPPVGQAAGLGVGRRRNKVGASDSTAVEELQRVKQEPQDEVQEAEEPSRKKVKIEEDPSEKHQDDVTSPRPNGKICKSEHQDMAKRSTNRVPVDEVPKVGRRPQRPVPNLIPIPNPQGPRYPLVLKTAVIPEPSEPTMSQKDINDICAKSSNSVLRDLASLFGSEDVFKCAQQKVPDLIPYAKGDAFKQKNASFFDGLREKLELGTNGSLMCKNCGHLSKCLTEYAKHQKGCVGGDRRSHGGVVPLPNISSSRCQHCRQRCKSSVDLYNHLQLCAEALKAHNLSVKDEVSDDDEPEEDPSKPHPMENKVFVWNDILVPMNLEVDDSNYEYTDRIDDSVSLDLSIRTQSPISSESSHQEVITTTTNTPAPITTSTPDKIPTHGNDISIAQHKRVFKCPHCTFWASTASRFHVHIVGHLNKKPFECSLCSYRSNWRWDITKHIKLKSVRDPAHESAKVLMTDETGRRNYTKYNKYLTEIPVSSEQSMDTSGGCGTRPKHGHQVLEKGSAKPDLPRLSRAPNGNDFSPLLREKGVKTEAEGLLTRVAERKRSGHVTDGKKTLFKCKKCNFKDASRDILLEHVKGHYQQPLQQLHLDFHQQQQLSNQHLNQQSMGSPSPGTSSSGTPQDLSLRGTSPDRADERHCRLKHSGDVRVVSTKNGQERIEIDELTDEPDHVDVAQDGVYKCAECPYSCDAQPDFERHLSGHLPNPDSAYKCSFCKYYVSRKDEVLSHLRLHGVVEPEEFLQRDDGAAKKFRCAVCPYVTKSKSQYTYHKQFHKPRGGQYSCDQCSYNVSKRHLLHQHLKVHGTVAPRLNGQTAPTSLIQEIKQEPYIDSPDIPLVWVSKNSKFSKMFKCRYCPHVNLRKVNIQEHEKMHGAREKKAMDVEHRCGECNYICNNAGVLSSHSKVHQGLYGTIHGLVDPSKTDEEQIGEMSNQEVVGEEETDGVLYFCRECPARFLKDNEFVIHKRFHSSRLFYKCPHCTYTSREKPHLNSHLNTHSGEYQDRTKVLQTLYPTSPNHPQPSIRYKDHDDGTDPVWIVTSSELSTLCSILNKPVKAQSIPLSGTDLFQQKFEAEQKHAAQAQVLEVKAELDPELMKGDPSFVYPTTLKNGVAKEKRYKCHKCPSAFEKREQYRVHLGLHGARQRYKCERCDYSVKYYANYVQHLKKHKLNEQVAMEEEEVEDDEDDTVAQDEEEVYTTQGGEDVRCSLCPYTTAKQTLLDKHHLKCHPTDDTTAQTFHCILCPYTTSSQSSLDKHQKHHSTINRSHPSSHRCDHCDYSDRTPEGLRDHVKWHLKWDLKVERMLTDSKYYMWSDPKSNITIKQFPGEEEDEEMGSSGEEGSRVIFEERAAKGGVVVYSPPLDEDIERKFGSNNNNKGERHYVDVQTGEMVDREEKGDIVMEVN